MWVFTNVIGVAFVTDVVLVLRDGDIIPVTSTNILNARI
jgi:hypothetical protein